MTSVSLTIEEKALPFPVQGPEDGNSNAAGEHEESFAEAIQEQLAASAINLPAAPLPTGRLSAGPSIEPPTVDTPTVDDPSIPGKEDARIAVKRQRKTSNSAGNSTSLAAVSPLTSPLCPAAPENSSDGVGATLGSGSIPGRMTAARIELIAAVPLRGNVSAFSEGFNNPGLTDGRASAGLGLASGLDSSRSEEQPVSTDGGMDIHNRPTDTVGRPLISNGQKLSETFAGRAAPSMAAFADASSSNTVSIRPTMVGTSPEAPDSSQENVSFIAPQARENARSVESKPLPSTDARMVQLRVGTANSARPSSGTDSKVNGNPQNDAEQTRLISAAPNQEAMPDSVGSKVSGDYPVEPAGSRQNLPFNLPADHQPDALPPAESKENDAVFAEEIGEPVITLDNASFAENRAESGQNQGALTTESAAGRLTATNSRSETSDSARSDGMADANGLMPMKYTAKVDQIARQSVQELPLDDLPGRAQKAIGLRDPAPRGASRLEAASWAAPVDSAAAWGTLQATGDAEAAKGENQLQGLTPWAKVESLVTRHVLELRSHQADTLDAVIKPEAGTELHLRLHWNGQKVEAQLRCGEGNPDALKAHWTQLQEALGAKGIQLASWEQSSVINNSASHAAQNGFGAAANQQDAQNPRQAMALAQDDGQGHASNSRKKLHQNHATPASRSRNDGWESWA